MSDKLDYLKEDNVKLITRKIEFELEFYKAICGTDLFKIVPIPTPDGEYLSDDDKALMVAEADEMDEVLIFQVLMPNGDFIIFDAKNNKALGYIPTTQFTTHS